MWAEALAAGGQRAQSETYVREALNYFEPKRIWEAALRGHMVAARVSQAEPEIDAHQASARAALVQLQSAWGMDLVGLYLTRPDIRQLSRGMDLQP